MYVDEFQNFANQSFADILSEARKYKLNLIIAHQYIEQMEEEVRDAVFGNVGTTVAFRVGPFDAEVLETIYQPVFMATDLVNLGFAQIYLTLMIDGVGSPPFSATTIAPFDAPPQSFVNEVIANSRTQFGKSRAEVERAIQQVQDENPLVMEAPKKKTYSNGNGNSSSATSSAPRAMPAPAPAPEPAPHKHVPTSHKLTSFAEKVEIVKEEVAKVVPAYRKEVPEVRKEIHAAPSATPKAHVARPAKHAPRAPITPASATRSDVSVPLPPRPALDGSQSLKDALAQALGHKPVLTPPAQETPPEPAVVTIHAPDLKSVLHTVAPQAEAPAATRPEPHPPRSMAELPEDELRSMLAVDESLDNERP